MGIRIIYNVKHTFCINNFSSCSLGVAAAVRYLSTILHCRSIYFSAAFSNYENYAMVINNKKYLAVHRLYLASFLPLGSSLVVEYECVCVCVCDSL